VGTASSGGGDDRPAGWKPTTEAKGKAIKFRLFAAILWVLAIGLEVFAYFWILKPNLDEVSFPNSALYWLIGLLVVIGLLAWGGSIFWKKANRLDPASRANKVRFFIQNQLGVIITMIAFIPIIVLIFINKNMDSKQKSIAGGIAVVLLLAVSFLSAEFDPVSSESMDEKVQEVIELTGRNEVVWTTHGKVYHLCDAVSDVNLESADNTIFTGTVEDAIAAGKSRLTLKVDQNLEQCGFAPRGGEEPAE
jgi:low affinity Fe/Cu permease